MLNLSKIFIVILILIFSVFSHSTNITQYEKFYLPMFVSSGEMLIAIRIFKKNNQPFVLIVNPDTLKTKVLPLQSLFLKNPTDSSKSGLLTHEKIQKTKYYELFFKHTRVDQEVKHAQKQIQGNILTIDLCPSSRPFEKDFFENLANATTQPFPVAISISGLWMVDHPKEFSYLIQLQEQKKLDITWVNHTFSHIYYSDLPEKNNFLLSEMINLDTEILLTEQYLLEHDQTPSVFFRFPGLVSNAKLLAKLKKYGLIPLSADAWLAIDEKITPGSIVLVHGNGNEHLGIKLVTPLINQLNWVALPGNI